MMRSIALIVVAVLGSGCRTRRTPPAPLPVSLEQARATALAAVAGRIEHEELDFEEDYENGRWVYEFEIQPPTGAGKQEVDVDALTGAVLGVKPDD